MIKPVTFQGCFNFNANLYALEVRSRFIDQSKANGYYKGYGNELAAQIVGQKIQIGTGAFFGARSYVRNHGGGISRPANF